MTKQTKKVSDDRITLTEAARMIAIIIYPQEDLRKAINKAHGRIRTAIEQRAFRRKHLANQTYLPKGKFEHWAARKWPKFFAVSFDLPQYLWPAQRTPSIRKPSRVVSRPIPVFDPNSVRVPVEFDKLKKLYLQTKENLIYMKWRLSNCEDELEEFREHDAAFRKERSEDGKKGGRGREK